MNNFLYVFIINIFFVAIIQVIYYYLNIKLNYLFLTYYIISSNILCMLSILIKFKIDVSNKINYIEDINLFNDLKNEVELLSIKYKIKTPQLIIFKSNKISAYATGIQRSNSYIFISDSLLSILNKEEIKSVLFHEFAHIKNNDIFKQLFLEYYFTSLTFYLFKIINKFKIPIISTLFILIESFFMTIFSILGLFISRNAEYKADLFSAKELKSSIFLINSLSKIIQVLGSDSSINYSNNFQKVNWGFDIFSTHPKTYKRIKRLEKFI